MKAEPFALPINLCLPTRNPNLTSSMIATIKPNLPIHITPHHLQLSPALLAFVHEKLADVPRIAPDALSADVVLRRHHGTSAGPKFSASARVALPGRDIHGKASHADLYSAIVKLSSRLARRSRKRKTRLAPIPNVARASRSARMLQD